MGILVLFVCVCVCVCVCVYVCVCLCVCVVVGWWVVVALEIGVGNSLTQSGLFKLWLAH